MAISNRFTQMKMVRQPLADDASATGGYSGCHISG